MSTGTAYSERFEWFWQCYPRHTAKKIAWRAWLKTGAEDDDALCDQIRKALEWQRNTPQWRDGIIPHPATWLNQERWTDEPMATRGQWPWRT